MKTLQFTNYNQPNDNSIHTKDKLFSVWLYWDVIFYFSDKKKMNNFLADLNKFLNIQIVDISTFYCNTFLIYRELWFFADATDSNISLHHFISIEKQFNLIYKQSNIAPRNLYIFKNFIDLIADLKDILQNLRLICTQKKISVTMQKIDSNLYNLSRIENDFKNYMQKTKKIDNNKQKADNYDYTEIIKAGRNKKK